MGFSDLLADVDRTIEQHLCDLYAVRAAGSTLEKIIPAWIDVQFEQASSGIAVPMQRATVEVAAITHELRKGDVLVRGRYVGDVFEKEAIGWRVTGGATTTNGDGWQVANVERFTPG